MRVICAVCFKSLNSLTMWEHYDQFHPDISKEPIATMADLERGQREKPRR